LGDAAAAAAKNREIDAAGLRKQLRGDLDWIVMKALEKDRTRRYETTEGLAADIERHLSHEPVQAKRNSTLYVLDKAFRRHKLAVGAGALLAVLVSIIAIVMTFMYQRQLALTAQAQRLLYISDLNAAGNAWENNDIGLFENILQSLVEESKSNSPDFGLRYLLHRYQTLTNTPHLKTRPGSGAVAFSRDGKYLATADEHGLISLWKKTAEGWREGRTFGESDDARFYTSVAFSPQKNHYLLLAYPVRNTIGLLNVSTEEESRLPENHEGAVWDVAFSKDGLLLASSSSDASVVLWDVESRSVRRILEGHSGAVRSVAFSPAQPLLASGGEDNTVRLWHYLKDDSSQVLKHHTGAVWALEFSPDGAYLASASADKSAVIWDVKTSDAQTLHGHRDEVRSLAFSPDQRMLATGSRDRTTKLWSLASYDEIASLRGTSGYANCTAFTPTGEVLATPFVERDIALWNVPEISQGDMLRLPGRVPLDTQTVHFIPGTSGELVICCTSRSAPAASLSLGLADALVYWTPETGNVRRLDLVQLISAMAVSGDGKVLAAAQDDRSIQLWQLPFTDALKSIKTLVPPEDIHGISALAFAQTGRLLVAGTLDGRLIAWDIDTKRTILDHSAHVGRINSIVCAPNNNVFASGGTDRQVKLWRLSQSGAKQPLSSFIYDSDVKSLAFSSDGDRLAVGTYEGSPIVIHHVNGRNDRVTHIAGHQFAVYGLTFSGDGGTLFSAGGEGLIKLWDVQTGRQRLVLDGHTSAFASMAVSPEEEAIATVDRSGRVRLWRAPKSARRTGVDGE
jgi:WD40 repeat protein